MRKTLVILLLLLLGKAYNLYAQQDSIVLSIHPAYDSASGFHRFWFGENYRKDWAAKVKIPVIYLSTFNGGLTPDKMGGGMQSKSLRLKDKTGKEWVIRSVEKAPELVLPVTLRQTFAKDVVDDATSAQHPFAAVLVPPVAHAVGVAHSNPFIGYVAPDKNLGEYAKTFEGMVVLLEERSPFLKSDNTEEMLEKLVKNNENTYDAANYLKARMIDVLFADWDRHADQWRWYDVKNGDGKKYIPIPRDRDQVVSVTEGLLPSIFKNLYLMPRVQGFTPNINENGHSLYKSAFLNSHPASQINHEAWTKIVGEFTRQVTDSVLLEGIKQLPKPIYDLRHEQFFAVLKSRRDAMPKTMEAYYKMINKIVDIRLSDKDEVVKITDTAGGLNVTVLRIMKDGKNGNVLMNKTYENTLTKEIRLFVENGNDKIEIDTKKSPVKLRIVTAQGKKEIEVKDADKNIKLYGRTDNVNITGEGSKLKKHLSNDSLNTAYMATDLYNLNFPLINAGLNADDGFLFGLGYKHFHQKGFRKKPYTSMQQLMVTHSFSTKAFKINFRSEWIEVLGKADVIMQANANAPNNTINFFGRGNESGYNKAIALKYYRTRFSTYDLDPALRWRSKKGTSLTIGPSLQYYRFDTDDNAGRFINNKNLVRSYDSSTIAVSKVHIGLKINYTLDKRNNAILPSSGIFINLLAKGYNGLNHDSHSYGQLIHEFAVYKSLNKSKSIVLSNRIGGGVTVGKTAFYQSIFLGGQENLLGYRQFRFSGMHSLYNNTELRIKLANVSSYILPGQLGLTGFFDVGRVWEKDEKSNKWHNGAGGGIYYVPAELAVFKFVMGHSVEGWYPYVTMGVRF